MVELGSTCSMHGDITKEYMIMVLYPQWKGPLGRPRQWWEVTIKIDLKRNRVSV